MASQIAGRGAAAMARTTSSVGKEGSGSISKLLGYFGMGIGGAATFAYCRMDWDKKPMSSGIYDLREGRKHGISEFRRKGSFTGSTSHMVGECPERFHHMRTGELTLKRQNSRNPNVRRQISKQIERLNSKFEKEQAKRVAAAAAEGN